MAEEPMSESPAERIARERKERKDFVQKFEYQEIPVNDWMVRKNELGEEGWAFCFHTREVKSDIDSEKVMIVVMRPGRVCP